jgi:MFS transporter, MCT family, solute carrier family 16 (monocarboxylic acid transporters), member 10
MLKLLIFSFTALVGSLTIGATFLFSPISGILVDKLGLRTTTFIGGILTTSGMFLSSHILNEKDEQFDPNHVTTLCFTYGIMFGTGAALAYTPTLAILGHYFKRYLGIVNGFVTGGSSVFTALMPIVLTKIEKDYGLKQCLQFMTVMSAFVILFSFIYKPLQPPPPKKERKTGRSECYNITRSIINFDNWKKKKYIIWAISIPIALFGYFVPYVHIGKFITESFPEDNQNLPLICIAITSGLGRLIFGFISDLPRVNRIFLQQISFYFIGLMTMCLPLTNKYYVLLGICLCLGLFDGCFITLLGPIAYDICGPHGAAQAIGFLLGLCSFGLTSGPPIAGQLFDTTGNYTLPFVLAGIPPIIGATLMFLIKFVKEEKKTPINNNKEDTPFNHIPHVAWDKGEKNIKN